MDKRDKWIAWNKNLIENEVREKYFNMVGREPDYIHSPKESKTDWWWTGWVSGDEYDNTNKYIDRITKMLKGGKMKW